MEDKQGGQEQSYIGFILYTSELLLLLGANYDLHGIFICNQFYLYNSKYLVCRHYHFLFFPPLYLNTDIVLTRKYPPVKGEANGDIGLVIGLPRHEVKHPRVPRGQNFSSAQG